LSNHFSFLDQYLFHVFAVPSRKDWFKGGKGKDPKLQSLDNDIDNYFKNKPSGANADAAAPAGDTSANAE
jgi:hypothetical protein